MNTNSKSNGWIIPSSFVLSVLSFLYYTFRFFNYVEDDAFIPMRYAMNFWHGAGWVMNSGERVEGCTSPLQLALVTLVIHFAAPDTALYVLKVSGLLIGLAVLRQTQCLALSLFPSIPWLAAAAPVLTAFRPDFAVSMINGLETGLAVLLVTGGLTAFIRATNTERGDQRLAAVWFLGAALARPELALLFPLLLTVSFLGSRSRFRGWAALITYVGPLALLLLARYLYYGTLLPNTYWAKQLSLHQALPLGLSYLGNFALPGSLWLAAALYSIGILRILKISGVEKWAILLPILMHSIFLLRSGGDWMSDGRFFMVILPLCVIVWSAAVLQIIEVGAWLVKNLSRTRFAAYGALLLVSFCAAEQFAQDIITREGRLMTQPGIGSLVATLKPHQPLEEWKIGNADGRLAIGRWISAHARPGQTVLASEMGLNTVVNPQIKFLDMRGLTDTHIAHMSGTHRDLSGTQGEHSWMDLSKPLGQYLFRRRPEWVALLWDVYSTDKIGMTTANTLYAPSGTFVIHCDGRDLTVATWKRRDVACPP